MTTRYEFGYGYGEIYRRRMRAQDRMHRALEREAGNYPEEDRTRMSYSSDYYDFRGAGTRRPYGAEYRARPAPSRRSSGRRRGGFGPTPGSRQWGWS